MAHDVDATVQFRMNSAIKDGAFTVLRDMGISPSEAMRVFITQVYKPRTLPLVITTDAEDTGTAPEAGYTEWLRARLEKTIKSLDSEEMKSYSSETAKAVLHARQKGDCHCAMAYINLIANNTLFTGARWCIDCIFCRNIDYFRVRFL
jgi:addiction module RelB/DinJ family antitoxin